MVQQASKLIPESAPEIVKISKLKLPTLASYISLLPPLKELFFETLTSLSTELVVFEGGG